MRYLLDTCTLSDSVKGQPGVMARIKATSPKPIVVSSPTRMEIGYGLALNSERARKLAPVLDAFSRSSARCRSRKRMHRRQRRFVPP